MDRNKKGGFELEELSRFWSGCLALSEFRSENFIQLLEETNELTVLQILARFSESLETAQRVIQVAIENENCEEIWKVCHKLAGAAELVGFKAYGDTARELNYQVRANPKLRGHLAEVHSFLAWTEKLSNQILSACPNIKSHLES